MTAETHGAAGPSTSIKDAILETGASVIQSFEPIKAICAHLNALHVYASDPKRCVEANHYCTHISRDVRQCLIYDAPTNPARLIGVEYMVPRHIYESFAPEERRLWHSHDFEVRSGMLIMPLPKSSLTPTLVWETAETKEMEEIVGLYGKTYHFWQVDRGDVVPLGEPQLMMSFTEDSQVPWELVKERDVRFGVETLGKRELRKDIARHEVHQDADGCWK